MKVISKVIKNKGGRYLWKNSLISVEVSRFDCD